MFGQKVGKNSKLWGGRFLGGSGLMLIQKFHGNLFHPKDPHGYHLDPTQSRNLQVLRRQRAEPRDENHTSSWHEPMENPWLKKCFLQRPIFEQKPGHSFSYTPLEQSKSSGFVDTAWYQIKSAHAGMDRIHFWPLNPRFWTCSMVRPRTIHTTTVCIWEGLQSHWFLGKKCFIMAVQRIQCQCKICKSNCLC